MNWLSFLAGTSLVLVTIVDVIWTALWVGGGAGPVTRAVANGAWRVWKTLDRGSHRLMVTAGPSILTLTVIVWLLLLWLGWFLLFSSQPASVLTTSTNTVSDATDRVYFVGYTIFTLGNGDFSPSGDGWQAATALAAGSGLFTATLAITYLLSVISAAVSGRAFAAEVFGLGESAAEVVSAAWDGTSYSGLTLPLQSSSSQLTKLSQQYLAYPVLQYFHAGDGQKSPIVAIAQLDQILTLSGHGVPSDRRPPEVILNSVRSSISNVLESLPGRFVQPAEAPLPLPDADLLRTKGLPALSKEEFARQVQLGSDRRKRVRGLLNAHGWTVDQL